MDHGATTRGRDVLPPPQAEDLAGEDTSDAGGPQTTGTASSHRRGRGTSLRFPGSWPLAAVLAVQTALSLRLVKANTAFQDEALYLWAGHREWAHWLHGAPIPPFSAYFSGAPVLYPPIGALADSVGGLTAARILSLAFMLGATVLLWDTARRLDGRRSAFFAAALFAVLGPTLHVGTFATYDAMSLFLTALATWFVVRAGERQDATGWMVAAGVMLALANATGYSTALFDPVVLAVALLTAYPRPGGRAAIGRIATLLTVTAALLIAGLLIGGSSYGGGVARTTVARVPGSNPAPTVLSHAWSWTGLLVLAALCGVAVSWSRDRGGMRTWLLAVLTVAAFLGPLEQAALRTTASLNKHVDVGAWFAAVAAGYALDKLIAATAAGRSRVITTTACVVALAFPVSLGASQSWAFSTDWPDSSSFVAIFGPLANGSNGHLLVEDPSIAEYYLPAGNQWQRWSSTRNIVLPTGGSTGGPSRAQGVVGAGNAGTFAQYIAQGYFSYIALNYADTTALDYQILKDLRASRQYHIIRVVPYGPGTYVIFQHGTRQ
ncbi:MAG: glycosyltransferase family 39 protein [Actinomycetota bacterium]